MPYRFLEEEATADVAFEAWGGDLPEVLRTAVDATMNVMVENIEAIRPRESRAIELENEAPDLLLFDLLGLLVYYKDTEQLLLRLPEVKVNRASKTYHLSGITRGERLDPKRHHMLVDVKAVTMHDLRLEQKGGKWRAHVVLDI